MLIEIKNRFNGKVILSGEYESLKDCLVKNSGAYLSGANLSRADLFGADLSRADLFGADLSGSDLSGSDLSGANLSGAYLFGADLSRADLSGSDLSGSDLFEADLSGANLSGANLYGANLSRVNEIILPIISISGTKHNFYYHAGIIKVGCESHTVAEWMICYAKIGEMAGYTESEIEEYYRYIKFCADLKPEAK